MTEPYRSPSQRQADRAVERLQIDPLHQPRVPWDTIHDLTGPVLPQTIWGICATTGSGKTTVAAHLIEAWIAEGKTVYVITLEQPPEEYRTALAALALGMHPQMALEYAWTRLPLNAKADIEREVLRQGNELQWRLNFSGITSLHADGLEREFEAAGIAEADVIVIDHWHRIRTGGYTGLEHLCDTMRELLTTYVTPVVALFQIHRGDRDPMAPYRPPNTNHIQGGEVIPQLLSVCLGLYRPTVLMSAEDVAQVRRGQRRIKEFAAPNEMGVVVMKHRTRGHLTGETRTLPYTHGRIRDPATEARIKEEERLQL